MAAQYRFSFGPWNIHEGADPFGPPVRPSVKFAKKLKLYKELGFDAVQFHDDDAVPELESKPVAKIKKEAAAVKKALDGEGLIAEFVAPRLWKTPKASTVASRRTRPKAGSGPSSVPNGPSTSPTRWARS